MPKKTTLLIILLSGLTAILIFLAIQSDKKNLEKTSDSLKNAAQKPNVAVKTPVEKTATVYFANSTLSLTSTQATAPLSVDLLVNSGKSNITGVQVDLTFDPKVISNVAILPPVDSNSFFGPSSDYLILFKEINQQTGKLSYAIAITPQSKPKQGIGKVGTITFNLKNASAPQTSLSFTSKTLVTKAGEAESVLKNTIPLTITVNH